CGVVVCSVLMQCVTFALGSAPAQPWSDAEIDRQIVLLTAVVEQILKRDPSRPFHLGGVVDVTAPQALLSPMTGTLDRVDIQNQRALTVNQAIEALPGVT